MEKIPLLVIAGPTASGKTLLAVSCALKFNGEVVSADSMQIYKEMDIATAKPSKDEMKGVCHHLIDFIETSEGYSVASFVTDAKKAVNDIYSHGKLPIVTGGTGLYIDSLVNNVSFIENDNDEELRKRLYERLNTIGADKMLAELEIIDAETAKAIHPNNTKRIIRAFEVYELTGKTMSQINAESKTVPSPYKLCYIGLNYRSRDVLYDRINMRVDLMLKNGLLSEAEKYYQNAGRSTSSQAIGYKELKPYLDGKISFDEAVENLKKSTRHYAKRQLTWFNANKNIIWFYPDDYKDTDELNDDVFKTVKEAF